MINSYLQQGWPECWCWDCVNGEIAYQLVENNWKAQPQLRIVSAAYYCLAEDTRRSLRNKSWEAK